MTRSHWFWLALASVCGGTLLVNCADPTIRFLLMVGAGLGFLNFGYLTGREHPP